MSGSSSCGLLSWRAACTGRDDDDAAEIEKSRCHASDRATFGFSPTNCHCTSRSPTTVINKDVINGATRVFRETYDRFAV